MQTATLLTRKEVAKPWGRNSLPGPFAKSSGGRVGEIWFEHPSQSLDLLVKYLFTSEKLSIQVHPDDAQARVQGLPSGKDECWLVLHAEPDAKLGIGTREPLSPEALHAAALDGSLEQLIDWKPVARGDFYYIPAGTVHAIGAGVTLVEVQQNIDITYRLFDYGRPRELHLHEGIKAASARPYSDAFAAKVDFGETRKLVDGPKFDLWLGKDWPLADMPEGLAHLIPLRGSIGVDGTEVAAGECLICEPGVSIDRSPDIQLLIACARS